MGGGLHERAGGGITENHEEKGGCWLQLKRLGSWDLWEHTGVNVISPVELQ